MNFEEKNKKGGELFDKLVSLRLPSLDGKAFLDVGCGQGAYCEYAAFDNAARVVGVDSSLSNVDKAKALYPDCDFFSGELEVIGDEKFDVVLVHFLSDGYDNFESYLNKLVDTLDKNGVMILDVTLSNDKKKGWVSFDSSSGFLSFLSFGALECLLESYAWKVVESKSSVYGKGLRDYVIHVRKTKPYVYLMMGGPGTGKTTISRLLFQEAGIEIVSGDRVYLRISNGDVRSSERLLGLVSENFSTQTIGKTTNKIFRAGLAEEIVGIWVSQSGGASFALDTYVPEKFRSDVVNFFWKSGYYPIELSTPELKSFSSRDAERKAKMFCFPCDEKNNNVFFNDIVVVEKSCVRQEYNAVWVLDEPSDGDRLLESVLQFSGWFLTRVSLDLEPKIYVETKFGTKYFSFIKYRKGAVDSIFEKGSVAFPWCSMPCGFRFSLDVESVRRGVELGVVLEGNKVNLASVRLEGRGSKASLVRKAMPEKFSKIFSTK